MKFSQDEALFDLLRMAVDDDCSPRFFTRKLNDEEWRSLRSMCHKQQISAVVYRAVSHLPAEQQPPSKFMFQWAVEAEIVKGHNGLLNAEASRLTQLFEAQGRKTAVLKGPANARLYPDPNMRQAGDIDLWVEGGRDSVIALLKQMGYQLFEKDLLSAHHVQLRPEGDVSVEIHYKPSSKNWSPFSSARLMRYLEEKIQNVERVPEGFNIPSMTFALAMQLSHIQHHFLMDGIGLKQIIDYFILLKHATEENRREINAKLSSLGLLRFAGALMWILGRIFGLDASKMICSPNQKLGKKMLDELFVGGNFGMYCKSSKSKHWAVLWLWRRYHIIRKFWFFPVEILGCELNYWFGFIKSIWIRIKFRRLSLWYLKNTK